MPKTTMPPALAAMVGRGAIRDHDVLELRRAIYTDGVVHPEDAEWLFLLDEQIRDKVPGFATLFIEAMTDRLVWQTHPEGHIDAHNAEWLIARISADGVVNTDTQLELLVHLLDRAASAPPSLSAFALRQVAIAVVEGSGPLADGRCLTPGVIGLPEVEMLRRILYAYAGNAALGISREEAEVLFDLNDRTREAANHPAWSDLFVKAIANFLMAARGYPSPTREEALRRAAWVDEETPGVGGMFSGMMQSLLTGGLRGVWQSYGAGNETVAAERNARFEAETTVAETVTADEVKWLADRIGRDGTLHANEKALLDFLREESPDIHPSLRTLIDTAA
ncbi:hypothetical protein [Methylobrevis pamukkalensis]|uniref:Uncharacterized protein n=1 Tax=Methylobrevis pamukkalensis TaxID=1439726 RepID=A0A1E3H2G7_9HYPH|nr:hypothetical protein [Methylobrevis pamukkalensis]ODN69721.1 hypothetical protein A6302_02969 [Methylobrevis pamukkalensis]